MPEFAIPSSSCAVALSRGTADKSSKTRLYTTFQYYPVTPEFISTQRLLVKTHCQRLKMTSILLPIMKRRPFSSCLGVITSMNLSRPFIPRLVPAISYSTSAQPIWSNQHEPVPLITRTPRLSIVQGPTSPPLWNRTLGNLIKEQAKRRGKRTALVVPWQNTRITYEDLEYRSSIAAKALLNAGLKHGDAVGIFAGNRYEYIELFLASARIGCPFVVFNTTNSPHELCSAVARSG